MPTQFVDGGLPQHQFDWETFDKQPVKVKRMTWNAVGSDVHFQYVIPAQLADAIVKRAERILTERRAENALAAYGPDHPEAKR